MGGGPPKDYVLVLLPQAEPKDILDSLRNKFPKAEFRYQQVPFTTDVEILRKAVPSEIWHDITVLYTLFSFPEKLSDAPKLELVQLASAGSNQIQRNPIYTDSKIDISTSTGIHGPQIAEWCVMTALVQSHKYNSLHDFQKEHRWGNWADEPPA